MHKELMKLTIRIGVLLLSGSMVFAQNPLKEAVKMGFSDVAATKQRAEAGDAQAQLSLADTLSSNFKKAESLLWYRKAAEQGVVEAKSRLGEMLLFGDSGIPANQSVKANPSEGIRWTFEAATNQNVKAFLNMSKAFQNGIGVNTNLVEAYAWLQLYAEHDSILGQTRLNQMALKLDTKSIQEAQAMASQFKAGHWPTLAARKSPEGDSRLKLNGITMGKSPLVMINGKTLAEGESATISLKEATLKIKCIQIKQDAVLISIEGETKPRWLTLK